MECKADLLEALKVMKVLSRQVCCSVLFVASICLKSSDKLFSQEPSSNQREDVSSSGPKFTLPMPDFGEDTWDYERHRWSKKISSLSTYEWYLFP